MKKILFLILIGGFFMQCSPKVNKSVSQKIDFRSKAPAPKAAPEVSFGDYDSFTMENGLRVIVVKNSKVPKLTIRLFIDRKPILEGEKAGYIEFAGALLSRGTKTKTKAQIDEDIDFLGSSFSTFSKGFYISGLSRHADKMLEIASGAVLNPAFTKEEFEKIKKQKLSEIASAKEDPNSISSNVSDVLNYGSNHPFGEIVTENTVNNISIEDCKKYYNDYFAPEKGYLVFVGDIDFEKAKSISNKYFGGWNKSAKSISDIADVTFPDKTKVSFVGKRGAVQSVIAITYPVDLKPNSPDLIKARVLNTIIGGFFRSRLNQNLREDHAYTYGIRSRLSDNMNVGQFRASASVRNEVTDSALYQVIYELNKIKTEKIDQEELDLVKSVMAGNFGRSLEKPRTIANFALKTERFNLPKNYYHDYLKNLSMVTADDVMEMAKKYIKPDAANIVVVGDKSVIDKLGQFGEVTMYDVEGEVIENTDSKKVDLTLKELLNKSYLALGKKEILDKVSKIESEYIAKMQGMEMKIWEAKVDGQKYAMKMEMMGQTMQSKKFDGKKGMVSSRGVEKEMTSEELDDSKQNTYVFGAVSLMNNKDAKLVGTENVDGVDYYVVEVKSENQTELYYFNSNDYLIKMQEIIVSQNGQSQTMKYTFSDFKEYNGVKVAGKIAMSGPMPMPIEFIISKYEINGNLDDGIFK